MAWMEIGQALAGGIFLSFLPLRLYELYRLPIKVRDDGSGRTKLVSDVQANTLHVKNMKSYQLVHQVTAVILAVLSFGNAAASRGLQVVLYRIPMLVAAAGICVLSPLEHYRCIGPSGLITLYLVATVILDIAQFVESPLTGSSWTTLVLAWGQMCTQLALLVLECREKGDILVRHDDDDSELPPEELAGILSRVFFWWVNPIILRGDREVLDETCVPELDNKLASGLLGHKMVHRWNQRGMITYSQSCVLVAGTKLIQISLSSTTGISHDTV